MIPNNSRKGLKTTLLISFLLVAMIPLVILGFFTSKLITQSTQEEITSKNLLLADSLAGEVEEFLDGTENVLGEILEVVDNKDIVREEKINDYLETIIKRHSFFDMIRIVDNSGKVIHVSPLSLDFLGNDVSGRNYFKETIKKRKTYWSPIFISMQTGQPAITVSKKSDNTMVIAYLNLHKLRGIVNRVKIGNSGYAAILDKSGTYIAHKDNSYMDQRINILKYNFVKQGLAGKEGTYNYYSNQDKSQWFASVALVFQTGWIVYVSSPIQEVFAPVIKIKYLFWIGTFISLIAAFIVARGGIERLLKPVNDFGKKANLIAGGNYDVEFKKGSYKEIDDLADDFKIMVSAVKLREKKLQETLREKELLLREIHHRVKNNMQVISSLLSLQSDFIKNEEDRLLLKDSQNRIKSMALVHEKLYRSEDLDKIDFEGYIKNLADELFRSYVINPDKIKLKLEVAGVYLKINNAIPCGLIINELVSNSLKYAFEDREEGEIKIKLRKVNNMIELFISDNGIGMPEDVDFRDTESLGLQLVTSLVEHQLQGEINLDNKNGTKFLISFGVVD